MPKRRKPAKPGPLLSILEVNKPIGMTEWAGWRTAGQFNSKAEAVREGNRFEDLGYKVRITQVWR